MIYAPPRVSFHAHFRNCTPKSNPDAIALLGLVVILNICGKIYSDDITLYVVQPNIVTTKIMSTLFCSSFSSFSLSTTRIQGGEIYPLK